MSALEMTWRRWLWIVAGAVFLVGYLAVVVSDDGQGRTASEPVKTTTTSDDIPKRTGGVAFSGESRSLLTDAPLRGVRAMTFDGGSLEGSGHVFSVDGKDLGNGVLTSSGRGAGVRSSGADLDYRGSLRIVGSHVITSLRAAIAAPRELSFVGKVVFEPDPKASRNADEASTTSTTAPPAVTLASGARLRWTGGGSSFDVVTLTGKPTWIDAPTTLRLEDDEYRHDLSWAGSGHVRADGIDEHPEYTGLRLLDYDVTITRGAATSTVVGRATVAQIYADGQPRLRTTATVGLLTDSGGIFRVPQQLKVAAGGRGRFVWAPRNTGAFDMNILRIRPSNKEASWINLALETAPRMWGGEPHSAVGGETAGFGKRGSGCLFCSDTADRIDATLRAGKADRRDIGFNVPRNTPPGEYVLRLVLEGNFTQLTVEVRVSVS